MLVEWFSDNVRHINEVMQRRARLVLRWVTVLVCYQATHVNSAKQVNSVWPPSLSRPNEYHPAMH